MKTNKTLLSICGPTAIGKTALAIEVAKKINTEILSNDSRQFYKELEIGTAVPSQEELQTVPHHFIHHLSIFDNYSVGDFEQDALNKLEELFQQYNTIILVGGSGLYEKALTEGLDNFPTIDPSIRINLNQRFLQEGILPLQELLKEKDPLFYQQIDLQNPQRLIRALEVCIGTDKPYSYFRKNNKKERPFKVMKFGLIMDRSTLYEQINYRVDKMIEMGLEQEALNYFNQKELNALQTVGYKEFFNYFEGKITKEEAIELIKQNTRKFAKRQITWFKKDTTLQWINMENSNKIETILKTIQSY